MLTLWVLTGCYTFTGSTLPGHLKTIRVAPVTDATQNPAFAENLTRGIIQGFESRSNLNQVNTNPHCELITTLKSYSHTPYNTSGTDVTDYRVQISVSIEFHDRVKGKELFKEDNLPGFATYSITSGETETVGQQRAIDNVVENILNNTVSGW